MSFSNGDDHMQIVLWANEPHSYVKRVVTFGLTLRIKPELVPTLPYKVWNDFLYVKEYFLSNLNEQKSCGIPHNNSSLQDKMWR